MAVAFLSSFLLCSYSVSPFDSVIELPGDDSPIVDQSESDEKLDSLDPDIDKESAGAKGYKDEENSLSDSDIDVLRDFICFDGKQIALDSSAYFIFPSNDEGLLQEEYYEKPAAIIRKITMNTFKTLRNFPL